MGLLRKETPEISPIMIDNKEIEAMLSATILRVVFLDDLKWQVHVTWITSHRKRPRLYFLSLLREATMDPKSLVRVYTQHCGTPRGGIRVPSMAYWAHQRSNKTVGERPAKELGHYIPGYNLQPSMRSGGTANFTRAQTECLQNCFPCRQCGRSTTSYTISFHRSLETARVLFSRKS